MNQRAPTCFPANDASRVRKNRLPAQILLILPSLLLAAACLLPTTVALASGTSVLALTATNATVAIPELSIPIPNIQFSEAKVFKQGGEANLSLPWIAQYVTGLYRYLVAIGGVVAAVMMMIGGFLYLTAGDSNRLARGKQFIVDALTGLVLILATYLLLNVINPDLVTYQNTEIAQIEKILFEVSPGIAPNAPDPVDPKAPPQPATIPKPQPSSGPTGSDGVPWFMQYDPKWNPKDLSWMPASIKAGRNDCTSIAQRGCGTTSLAMVLNFYGAGTDPMKTAAWGLGCKGGWQPYATLDAIGKQFSGFKGEYIGNRKSDINKRMDKLISLVNSGQPIIYNCAPCEGWDVSGKPRSYGGHYMVLTGYDQASRTFRVNDPGRGAGSRIRTMTYDFVANNWVVAVYIHR